MTFHLNRSKKSGGGIASLVHEKDKDTVIKVAEGTDDQEYIVTRHGKYNPPINVMNVYNEVESHISKDRIVEKWQNIMNEVHRIEARGEPLIMVGDFNAHISDLVPNNKTDKMSVRGKLVKEFLESKDYVLVNAMKERVIGGPHTRRDPADPSKGSVLDLVIVSSNLEKYLEVMKIDTALQFTPFRMIDNSKVKHSDHLGIVVKFKNIP